MSATSYAPLSSKSLEAGVNIVRPHDFIRSISLSDAALSVMTDLTRVPAVSIRPEATLDEAERLMRVRGIRMLLVLDDDEAIIGLITLTDIKGEKPMQIIQARGGTHGEVRVSDIMVAQGQVDVLCLDDVQRSRVGDVVATLKASGRQHALVVEREDEGRPQVLRGIFSISQIGRQLEMDLEHTEFASTFAAIEALLKVA